MEFASRRTGVPHGVLALAGLVALTGGACRCDRGRPAPEPAPRGPEAALTLAGRVTDEVDRPLPEAHVLAFGPLGDAALTSRREATTDLGGRFSFEGLAAGRYTLLVEAAGLAAIEPPALDVPGAPAVVRLSGQGRSLSGTVSWRGAPVPGARVRLGGGTLARSTLSDDAGRFVFHGLGAGTYALRATKGNLASAILTDVPTDDGGTAADAGARGPARLELDEGRAVSGIVVDEAGRGLAEAEVRAEVTLDDPLADAVSTRPDGRFALAPLPAGRFRVVARTPGYLLRAAANVTLAPDGGVADQRLELVRAASAEGRVVDARGAPVEGAQVRCGGGGADLTDLAVIFDRLPLAAEAAALAGAAGPGGGATKIARTDARGAFRLDALLPGPVRLAVTRAPFAPLETETTSLAPGEHRDLGVLALPDAVVAAAPDAGAVAAAAPMPADATLVGVARDSGNRPLARARVRAWPLGAGDGAATAAPSAPALASAVTDAGGHFTLARVPRATLLLELEHAAYPTTFARGTPGAAAELVAPIPGGIDGEVREHVTGAAVAGARVEAIGPGGQRALALARKGAATFQLPRLRPGHWTLTARAPGYRPTIRDVDVPESPILGDTSVRALRIELDVER
jgi:protocatechuate 3,4-dioxygenase beta subunit